MSYMRVLPYFQRSALLLTFSLLCFSKVVLGQIATTTALNLISGSNPVASVQWQQQITLKATVQSGSTPITSGGTVNFCDADPATTSCTGSHLLGTVQLITTPSTRGTVGTASLSLYPLLGNHTYWAAFLGTPHGSTNYQSSTGSATLTVTGQYPTSTALAPQTGGPGNYSMVATVTGTGSQAILSGKVSFQDRDNANFALATGTLDTGSFTSAIAFPVFDPMNLVTGLSGQAPKTVAVADFDGDGISDLITINSTGPSLQLYTYLGRGGGNFQVGPISSGTFLLPFQIAVGDFNGDGIPDLAVADAGSTPGVHILRGVGNGSFTEVTGSPFLSTAVRGVEAIVTGDFNGDGHLDVALTDIDSDQFYVMLGDGNFGFPPANVKGPFTTARVPESIVAADFDGDGILDLAVANLGANTVSLWKGAGDGTFIDRVDPSVPTGSSPYALAVADFDGDGKPDLGISNIVSSTVVALRNQIQGSTWNFSAFAGSPYPVDQYANGIVTGDFNRDGKADLAVVNGNKNDGTHAASEVTVLEGKGDGTFTVLPPQSTNDANNSGTGPISLATGDFAGNGGMDIVTVNNDTNSLTVLLTQLKSAATATVSGISVVGSGIHNVDAYYSQDTLFGTSTSPSPYDQLQAQAVGTTLGLTPQPPAISYGQQILLTADLTPNTAQGHNATGTVSFYHGSTLLGTGTLSGGIATTNTTGLPVGPSVVVTANYPGDINFAASLGQTTVAVTKATPTITWSTPAAISYGTPLSTVQLNATANTPGVFAYDPPAGTVLNAGTQQLSAQFTPSDATNYNDANGQVPLTVNKQATNTALVASATAITQGQALTLTATVSGTINGTPALPSGTVSFYDGNNLLGTSTLSGNTAGYPTTSLAPGAHSITALYNGDSNFATSISIAVLVTVNQKITPAITWPTPSPIVYGISLSVTQLDATANVLGNFAYNPPAGSFLNAGPQQLLATFTPTDTTDYTTANKQVTLTVNKQPTAATLKPSADSIAPGQTVTLTAGIAGTINGTPTIPSGTVAFYDGSSLLGSNPLANGTASYSTSSLTAGSHTITARYSGDANFVTSDALSTITVAQTSLGQDFTFTNSGPTSQTVAPAGSASFTFALAPTSDTYPDTVTFTVAGVPPGGSYIVSPSSIASNAGAQTVTLTVQIASTAARSRSPLGQSKLPVAVCLLLLPLIQTRRLRYFRTPLNRYIALVLLIMTGIAGAAALTGCGTQDGFLGKEAGSYAIKVTANAGSVQHASSVTLILR